MLFIRRSSALSRALALCVLAGTFAAAWPLAVHADIPQNLSAKIDGKVFESDDGGITYLQPVKGTLNLIASTKGAGSWPPPKTPIDRISFICRHFKGAPVKWAQPADFGGNGCEVRFIKGVSPKPFGDPQAEYQLVSGGAQSIEITSVKGKVIEGRFSLELVDPKSKARMKITDGVFKAEDRQI